MKQWPTLILDTTELGTLNLHEKTLKFADLTLPLQLPVTEWVMSFEVGDIASQFESVFVRNLHRHNCKGVILSWGVLGQGENHINCHSYEYVVEIFGYYRDVQLEKEFRKPEGNRSWFVKSVIVLRRKEVVCISE